MHILHLNQRNQILFRYLRDKKKKKKEGGSEKGGENLPISPPLDPRLTSETGITIYNYRSHRKLVNVKGLKKKKRLVCINLRPEYFSKYFCHEFQIGFITFMQ